MPNDFALLGSALYGRLGTVQYTYPTTGTATTTGSVGVYNSMVVGNNGQPVDVPYFIFQHQAGRDEYTFNTRGESLDYMVKAVSDRQTPSQAYALYAGAHDALQDAPLNISGYTVLRVRRQSRFEFRDTDGYWHVGGLYRIDTWD
jgi:hypothetical protein